MYHNASARNQVQVHSTMNGSTLKQSMLSDKRFFNRRRARETHEGCPEQTDSTSRLTSNEARASSSDSPVLYSRKRFFSLSSSSPVSLFTFFFLFLIPFGALLLRSGHSLSYHPTASLMRGQRARIIRRVVKLMLSTLESLGKLGKACKMSQCGLTVL